MIIHFYVLLVPIDELKNTFFGLKKDPCLNEQLGILQDLVFLDVLKRRI